MSSKKEFSFFHSTPVQIRFNDFDFLEHVNNSVYQNYYDLARTSYFDAVFKQKMQWNFQGLVLAKVTLEFIRPIFMEDQVEVHTKIIKLGNKSLVMFQQIINPVTKEIKSTCESIMVAFAQAANKPCPIPDEWRQKIISFEKDIDF